MGRPRKHVHQPEALSGVQSSGGYIAARPNGMTYEEEAAKEYAPEQPANEFKPVVFCVVGSFQFKAIDTIVVGNKETNYTYVARTQKVAEFLDSKGFKRY